MLKCSRPCVEPPPGAPFPHTATVAGSGARSSLALALAPPPAAPARPGGARRHREETLPPPRRRVAVSVTVAARSARVGAAGRAGGGGVATPPRGGGLLDDGRMILPPTCVCVCGRRRPTDRHDRTAREVPRDGRARRDALPRAHEPRGGDGRRGDAHPLAGRARRADQLEGPQREHDVLACVGRCVCVCVFVCGAASWGASVRVCRVRRRASPRRRRTLRTNPRAGSSSAASLLSPSLPSLCCCDELFSLRSLFARRRRVDGRASQTVLGGPSFERLRAPSYPLPNLAAPRVPPRHAPRLPPPALALPTMATRRLTIAMDRFHPLAVAAPALRAAGPILTLTWR